MLINKNALCSLKVFNCEDRHLDYYSIVTNSVNPTEETPSKVTQFIFDMNINKEEISDITNSLYNQDIPVIDVECSILNKNKDLSCIKHNSILVPVQLAYVKIINKYMYHFIPSSYFRNTYFSDSISLNKLQINVLGLGDINSFIEQEDLDDLIDLSIGQEYLFAINFNC